VKLQIHEPIVILPVVSYVYETSLTLRKGHGLRMFWNRVVRKIFGPRMEEVTGGLKNYIMRLIVICVLHRYY
jgi:hypothetical protein